MTVESVSPAIAGLGIGVALAGAPGPVQAVPLAEAHRGGIRAMAALLAGLGLWLLAGGVMS